MPSTSTSRDPFSTTKLCQLSLEGLPTQIRTVTLELDAQATIRTLLHDAAGLQMLFAPGLSPSLAVALLLGDTAASALRALVGVVHHSDPVIVETAEVLPTLRSALALWMRHVLEHAPHPSGGASSGEATKACSIRAVVCTP